MKTLVVINGVTGAIGGACLARFSREHDTDIIGLSRQALPAESFCRDGRLPGNTIICSIGDITNPSDCQKFAGKINRKTYDKIVYVHAVGTYPFEIDASGNHRVAHDDDHDGIDDRVIELSHNAFFAMVAALESLDLPVRALIFGGIADKFKPLVHKSWWTVIGRIRERMKAEAAQKEKTSYCILNISSVICPHELLTRPFVFRDTNADPKFWLMPHEVAEQVVVLAFSKSPNFLEDELYHQADYYEEDYFTDAKFTKRKKAELGLKK